jgi:transcriptional regulator with XRE-family HTH domain
MAAYISRKSEEKRIKTPELILGLLIRRERVLRDWSQAHLARLVNEGGLCRLSQAAVSDIENGERSDAIEVFAIASAFRLPITNFQVTTEMMKPDYRVDCYH